MNQWINPFSQTVLLPCSKVNEWAGDANGLVGSDYEKVCKIDDYCGVIFKDNYQIIVFADETNPQIWLESKAGIYLLRWHYAEKGDDLIEESKKVIEKEEPLELLNITIKESAQCLIDAIEEGTKSHRYAEVILQPGSYNILTYYFKHLTNSGVIHLFKKI
ncbi:Imm21 family immunity protein [Botryobacter ruber]|uniref:Imm21 family immunity protein n=1 Tax=Botryobacter ruber TaxID=2171629 RepID=UPI000E0BFB2D|nr:Imm21 family immunity protein [Botryobacter ruber]